MSYFQIFILALVQGAAELLPVSSSAHVIAVEKLMKLDPSSPDMVMLLVMLHTGTMFAVIVYFWKAWMRDYFTVPGRLLPFLKQIVIATACTGVVGFGLKEVIEKVFMHNTPHAEIEDLFSNLPLIAAALAVVGALIIYSGFNENRAASEPEVLPKHSCIIGVVQGLALPFRGFSRSGSTISAGLLLGLPKQKLEEFSFALAVVLTPIVIAQELHRLMKAHALSGDNSVLHLLKPGLVGMVLSFAAGLLALKWLSRWLEGGYWKFFGFYCFAAAFGMLAMHFMML